MNALMSMMPFEGGMPSKPRKQGLQSPMPLGLPGGPAKTLGQPNFGPMTLGMPQNQGKGQMPFSFPNSFAPQFGNAMMNFNPLMNYGRMVQRY